MSPMIFRARLVMALWGTSILDHKGLKPTDGVRNVGLGGHSLEPMCNAPSVVPSPVCTDECIQGLMFPHALNDGVPGSLIVATLDVEVAQQRLEDQGGQERNPCLQQIDECGVGAELFEDFLGESTLEEPYTLGFSRREDDGSKSVVNGAVILWMPTLRDWVAWS